MEDACGGLAVDTAPKQAVEGTLQSTLWWHAVVPLALLLLIVKKRGEAP